MEETISLFANDFVIKENNPFKDRKFVLDGKFSKTKRDSIKNRISMMGGEYVSGDITKNIHYYITSEIITDEELAKFNKLEFNGYHPRRIYESDLEKIFKGEYDGYYTDAEIKKDLILTYQHYENNHVIYRNIVKEPSGREYIPNPIYGKNLYLGANLSGEKIILSQLLGLLGVYSGMGLSDATQVIVLSEEAFCALKNNQRHEELNVIQDTYNYGLAMWYDYLLTTESELLAWIKRRCDFTGDKVCLASYNEYIQSKK